GNPPAHKQHLPVGQIGTAVERHALADDTGGAFELLDEVAVVGIAGDDPDGASSSRASYLRIDELIVGDVVGQVQLAGGIASDRGVAVRARRAGGAIRFFESL